MQCPLWVTSSRSEDTTRTAAFGCIADGEEAGPETEDSDLTEIYSNDPEQGISGSPLPDNFLL